MEQNVRVARRLFAVSQGWIAGCKQSNLRAASSLLFNRVHFQHVVFISIGFSGRLHYLYAVAFPFGMKPFFGIEMLFTFCRPENQYIMAAFHFPVYSPILRLVRLFFTSSAGSVLVALGYRACPVCKFPGHRI